MARYGSVVGKTLELLAAGLLLGFVKDKAERHRLLEECDYIWSTFDQKKLKRVIDKFKLQGHTKSVSRGLEERIALTDSGRKKFLEYKFYRLKLLRKRHWDKKWRIVLFDIPEVRRKVRDALRKKLKGLGFLEFQKSVFVFPYPCGDEINFVINFFNISDHVFYIEAPITPDNFLRRHFKI